MPWTFAHPAAVLPLYRLAGGCLPLPALIAGSLAPDAGYYIGQFALARQAHSWSGLLCFAVPAALLILQLLRVLARDGLLLLPAGSRLVLDRALVLPGGWRALLSARVLLACALGAATHLLWDMATHRYGGLVLYWPWLADRLPLWPGLSIPVFKLLQYGSSVLGVLLLYRAFVRECGRYARGCPDECGLSAGQSRRVMLVLLAISGLVAVPLAYRTLGAAPFDLQLLQVWVVRSIVLATVVLLLGSLLAGRIVRGSGALPASVSG
ncbi:DUF4184 family protein [Chitinilyticum litopenaei]|uniref:DUF4184 family protein n=1 Tax=Chitinilyticum litopenaei TaxID=1121276 RepID=UPI000422F83E|nr:DUF4184 family protein [Chitinilyticum litopenaei]